MRKPCCSQYRQDLNKGAWSKQEDAKLVEYIREHGEGCWRALPKAAGLLRCGKSCKLRWINYLRPDVNGNNFGEDEEDLIIKLHALLGNRWSLIAGRLPGRTDNEIKNYWNSHLRRKLASMGIDPNNHRVTLDFCHTSRSSRSSATSPTCHSSRANKPNKHNLDVCYQKFRSKNDRDVDDQLSDAGSCLQGNSCRLPDLNLDLTISMDSKSAEPIGSSSGLIGNDTLILFQ